MRAVAQPETPQTVSERWVWNHSAMLRSLRTEFRASQADLARRAGLSPSRLSRIESGAEPTVSEFVAIADALGVHASDLLPARRNEPNPIIVPPHLYEVLRVLTRIPEDEIEDVVEAIFALDRLRQNAVAHTRMREQTRVLLLRSEHALRDARTAELSGNTDEIMAMVNSLAELAHDLEAEASIEPDASDHESLIAYYELVRETMFEGHATVALLEFARAYLDTDRAEIERTSVHLQELGIKYFPAYIVGHLRAVRDRGAKLDYSLIRSFAEIPKGALAELGEAESISLSEFLSDHEAAAGGVG